MTADRQRNIGIAFVVSLAAHIGAAVFISRMPATPARQASEGSAAFELGTAFDRSSAAPPLDARPRVPRGASPNGAGSGAPGSGNWGLVRPVTFLARKAESANANAWITHLWESTVFALGVAILTLAFRRTRAHVRYWLWFAASVKFLIPFSTLVALGAKVPLAPAVQTLAEPIVSFTVAQISQPFPGGVPAMLPPMSMSSPAGWIALIVVAVWASGVARIVLIRFEMWMNIRSEARAARAFDLPGVTVPRHVRVRVATGLMEPGVFGFWRPILLLPTGIADHLTPAQLEAVVAHECCHIHRRDNLTAAIHMAVEAVFWFHPLVWWIGGRLVHERERACDEHVLLVYGDPRAYADGILNVCKQYVETQLACVAGVSSSDLKTRIEAIMRNENGEVLSVWRKAVLAFAGTAAVAIPVLVGSLIAAPLRASQSPAGGSVSVAFETASVKPSAPTGMMGGRLDPQPSGRFTATNSTVEQMIRFAYERPDFLVAGGPAFVHADRFDVEAKAEGPASVAEERLMLRRLLADRFKLKTHTEARQMPIYALVMARSDGRLGPRLRKAEADCAQSAPPVTDVVGFGPGPTRPGPCGFFGFAPGTNLPAAQGGLAFRGLTMTTLTKALVTMVQRPVIDDTRLAGYYDGDFDFLLELPPPPPPPGVPNPWRADQFISVFTVFPEQLGLKLDSRRGPVEMLIVDSAAKPIAD